MDFSVKELFPVSLGYLPNRDLDMFKIALEIYGDPSLSIIENSYNSDRFMLQRDYNLMSGSKDLYDFWQLIAILRETFQSIKLETDEHTGI